MSGYLALDLKTLLEQQGENETKSILSLFSCPKNLDVESFLKNSAIAFTKQGISNTYLIMTQYNNQKIILGYYTLAIKNFDFDDDSIPSQTWKRRLSKFGHFDTFSQSYSLPAPLIAQLGKNFAIPERERIPGHKLLKMALDKVQAVQSIIGGKIVYLECENNPKLIDFYSQNGFASFGLSKSKNANIDDDSKKPLILMLKYLR